MYHLIDKNVRGEDAYARFSPSQVRFLQASLTKPMNQKNLSPNPCPLYHQLPFLFEYFWQNVTINDSL